MAKDLNWFVPLEGRERVRLGDSFIVDTVVNDVLSETKGETSVKND